MLLLATSATTFYLPGLAPVTYCTTKVKTEFDTLLFYKNIICFIEVLNIFLLKCVHVYIQESTTCSNDIKLFVNRLNSEESVIPYEYHHFDFCKADESQAPHENLGQVRLMRVKFSKNVMKLKSRWCLVRESDLPLTR